LPGFKQVQPRVFAGMFPIVSDDYDKFRDALSKLRLNDSALHYEPEGVHCTRLRFPRRLPRPAAHGHRAGAPRARIPDRADHVRADRHLRSEEDRRRGSFVDNPTKLPPVDRIDELREPIIIANILVPPDHVGGVLQAVQRETRPAEEDALPRQPGLAAVRDAARRRWCSTSSTA
jgi:GTP-binding protein LepA